MAEMIESKRIIRLTKSDERSELDDDIIRESRLTVTLDGREFLQVVLSPSMIHEYALGFLLTRGLIAKLEDISSLTIKKGRVIIERTPALRERLDVPTLLESTGTKNIDLQKNPRTSHKIPDTMLSVRPGVLIDGVGRLSKMPIYNRTGGTHCAILFSPEGDAIVSAEDIGRHNSVDKAIGGGFKQGIDFSRVWLAVSGRLPADMVFKAVVAGIPLIASVSAPTSAGIAVGERAGVTVIGFARGGRFNCYCRPERIA